MATVGPPRRFKTPPKSHEKTAPERERKRANMGAGEEKKARNFGPPTLRAPHPAGPPLPSPSGFHTSGPNPSGPNFFQVRAPTPSSPPALRALHFFLFWAPCSFFIFQIFFFCFLFVKASPMLIARAHACSSCISLSSCSSQRVGALSLIPFCLGISEHPSRTRSGHPRYAGARSAGRPWVARSQCHTAVQSSIQQSHGAESRKTW